MHSNAATKHANEGEANLVLKRLRFEQRREQKDQVNQEKGDNLVHYLKSIVKLFLKWLKYGHVAC